MLGDFIGEPVRGLGMLTAETGQMGVDLQAFQHFILKHHIRHERRDVRHIVADRVLIAFGIEDTLPGKVAFRLELLSRVMEGKFRTEVLQFTAVEINQRTGIVKHQVVEHVVEDVQFRAEILHDIIHGNGSLERVQVFGFEPASPGGVKAAVPVEVGSVHERLRVRKFACHPGQIKDKSDTR